MSIYGAVDVVVILAVISQSWATITPEAFKDHAHNMLADIDAAPSMFYVFYPIIYEDSVKALQSGIDAAKMQVEDSHRGELQSFIDGVLAIEKNINERREFFLQSAKDHSNELKHVTEEIIKTSDGMDTFDIHHLTHLQGAQKVVKELRGHLRKCYSHVETRILPQQLRPLVNLIETFNAALHDGTDEGRLLVVTIVSQIDEQLKQGPALLDAWNTETQFSKKVERCIKTNMSAAASRMAVSAAEFHKRPIGHLTVVDYVEGIH